MASHAAVNSSSFSAVNSSSFSEASTFGADPRPVIALVCKLLDAVLSVTEPLRMQTALEQARRLLEPVRRENGPSTQPQSLKPIFSLIPLPEPVKLSAPRRKIDQKTIKTPVGLTPAPLSFDSKRSVVIHGLWTPQHLLRRTLSHLFQVRGEFQAWRLRPTAGQRFSPVILTLASSDEVSRILAMNPTLDRSESRSRLLRVEAYRSKCPGMRSAPNLAPTATFLPATTLAPDPSSQPEPAKCAARLAAAPVMKANSSTTPSTVPSAGANAQRSRDPTNSSALPVPSLTSKSENLKAATPRPSSSCHIGYLSFTCDLPNGIPFASDPVALNTRKQSLFRNDAFPIFNDMSFDARLSCFKLEFDTKDELREACRVMTLRDPLCGAPLMCSATPPGPRAYPSEPPDDDLSDAGCDFEADIERLQFFNGIDPFGLPVF